MMTIPASSGVRDTDPSSVGNMEGAFFRGKRELLDWINKTFDMDVSKVELCASGAIFCQIVDALYPNKVPMTKVKWNAKLEHEMIQNYKVLQKAFADCGVIKHIEVDKLIKAKPLDNLEMLQWMRAYWERRISTAPETLEYIHKYQGFRR
eukprot:GHVT01105025.1.p1 GENE.GHVT01105025.1~~GHVT01105025.1.p1  ORF type:complete len:150 (-),score=12.31 GHVT01105025.1:1090-1539(-)